MALFLSQRWKRQPSYPVEFNEASQLYRPGLRAFYPSGGRAVRKGTISVVFEAEGQRFIGDASASNYWQASATKIVSALNVFTLAALFRTVQTQIAGGYTIFGERGSTGNDIVKITCNETGQTANVAGAVVRNTAGSLFRINVTAVTVNDGKLHTACFVKRAANSWELDIDAGKGNGTNATNMPGTDFTSATPLLVANDLQGPTAFDGALLAVAVPNFAWRAPHYAEFKENPWQLFRPIQQRIYIDVPAAAGGVTYTQLERGIRGINRGVAIGTYH